MKTEFPIGDVLYYYHIHKKRMQAKGLKPVSYTGFYKRIRSGMVLHDAIYKQSTHLLPRRSHKMYADIEADKRRTKRLLDENVQIVTFKELEKVENYHHYPHKKKGLLDRFISLLKK